MTLHSPTPVAAQGRFSPGFQYTASALVIFLALLGSHLATPLYPIWQRSFGLSTTDITVIFSCYPLGVTAGLLYGGRMGDQFGRKPMIYIGILTIMLSSLTYLVASGMAHLMAARILNGIAIGLMSGPAAAALVELHPTDDRGAASRIAAIAMLASPAAGLLLATLVVHFASEELAVMLPFALQLVGLVTCFVLALTYVETIRPENRRTFATVSWRIQTLYVPADIRTPFVFATVIGVLVWAGTGLWLALGPVLVGQVIGSGSRLTGGLVVVAFLATAGVVQLFARRMPYMRALMISCYLTPPSLLLVLATLHWQSAFGLGVGAVLAGISQGLGWMGASELVNRIAPAAIRASVLSVLYIAGYFGAAVPIIATGIVADAMGLFPAVVMLLALFTAVAVAMIVMGLRYQRTAAWTRADGIA